MQMFRRAPKMPCDSPQAIFQSDLSDLWLVKSPSGNLKNTLSEAHQEDLHCLKALLKKLRVALERYTAVINIYNEFIQGNGYPKMTDRLQSVPLRAHKSVVDYDTLHMDEPGSGIISYVMFISYSLFKSLVRI